MIVGTFLGGTSAQRHGWVDTTRENLRPTSVMNYLKSLGAPSLPVLVVDMRFQHFHKIEAKRREALERGILFTSDDDFVPAQLRFDGRTIPVRMRLKGDWTDHLETNKWSFRIKVRGEDNVLGMRRFSIQHPMTRNYVMEWGFLENLRREGIVAPRYGFLKVTLNGEDRGIHAIEEFSAEEMIESQQRREGLFINWGEDLYWSLQDRGWSQPLEEASGLFPLDHQTMQVETHRPGRIDAAPELRRQRDVAVSLLRGFQQGTLPASRVFDTRLLARFLAISELWSARHGLHSNNLIFYYNPLTARLEPVGFDSHPWPDQRDRSGWTSMSLIASDERSHLKWYSETLRDPDFAKAYVGELERVTSDEYLDDLQDDIGPVFEQHTLALRREWPSLRLPWASLIERAEHIRMITELPAFVRAVQIKPESQAVRSTPAATPEITNAGAIVVEAANLLAFPVELMGFGDGREVLVSAADAIDPAEPALRTTADGGVILPGRNAARALEFTRFHVSIDLPSGGSPDDERNRLHSVSRLLGGSATRHRPVPASAGIASDTALPDAPSLESVLGRHSFLETADTPRTLRIRKGKWTIDEDLILPAGYGLEAGPGTTLLFGPEVILLSRGPLTFRGDAEDPIVLDSAAESWPGLVVLESDRPSAWEHVTLRNTSGVERANWITSAGVTFYRSPVRLARTRIEKSSAEDAVNIIRTTFAFDRVEISHTVSDGLDADFADGEIERSSFHDIGGDAIDVSGSNVRVADVLVRAVGDKGISAGEASNVDITRMTARDVGIGVVSKDLSSVSMRDCEFGAYSVAGLAAFRKKSEYGPASITAEGVLIGRGETRTLIQSGSWIEFNGQQLLGTDIDVEALYRADDGRR